MSFSTSTVVGAYIAADGTPGYGEVQFTLQQAISNGAVTLAAGTTCTKKLDASGNLTQQLVSTADQGTAPQGGLWRFDERINGESRTFFGPVPSGGVSVTIESLSPFVSGSPAWG